MAIKVGLVSRLDEPRALEVTAALAKQLRKKGIGVVAEIELAKRGRLGGGKELSDLKFDPSQDRLDYLLEKAGERVLAFFHDFSNTTGGECQLGIPGLHLSQSAQIFRLSYVLG